MDLHNLKTTEEKARACDYLAKKLDELKGAFHVVLNKYMDLSIEGAQVDADEVQGDLQDLYNDLYLLNTEAVKKNAAQARIIYRITERPGDEYPFNVQEIKIIDGKEVYSGFGRFCRTKDEAEAYIQSRKDSAKDIYTTEQWKADHDFMAQPGQEVTEDIYNEMLNVMPPKHLPHSQKAKGYAAGFLMGEATDSDDKGRALYHAFANKDGHYYYLGALPEEIRYTFSCKTAGIDGAIIYDFDDDKEAIDYAADHEATCYRLDDDGNKEEIYNPQKEGGL